SPGMHPRHYRPRTPLYLGTTRRDGRGAVLRIGKEMPADPRAYASVLYETLHRLDAEGLDWIAVELPPDTPERAGVADLLEGAAGRAGGGGGGGREEGGAGGGLLGWGDCLPHSNPRHVFNKRNDGGVVEIALAIVHQGHEHLLRQRCEGQRDLHRFSRQQGVA